MCFLEKRNLGLLLGAGVAAAGAAAVGAASYASTRFLMCLAMDRQEPRIPYMEQARTKLRGTKSYGPFLSYLSQCGQYLQNTPHRTVKISGHDGQLLTGHYFEVPNPKRVIVAMHGWRSSWYGDFGMVAEFWRKTGCNVLYAEQRGQGQSGGEHISFGMIERYDCLKWVDWVNEQTGQKLPVYLAGVSMGATTVLMASGLKLPSNVRGVLADCGFTCPDAIWKHVAEKNLHLMYPLHRGMADVLCRQKIRMSPSSCSTVEALKKSSVAVFLAHGAQDRFVPVEMTYENYMACPGHKHLLIVPGADHGMSYYLEKEQYEQMVLHFFKCYDRAKELA